MTDRGSFNWLRNEKVMKIQYPKQLLIEYGLTLGLDFQENVDYILSEKSCKYFIFVVLTLC